MKKDLFTDGVSHIDVDAVERLLQIEQNMQAKKRRQRYARLLVIPAAALIALMVCMTAVIIPFIPKTLDVAYEPVKGLPENVWVYYVNDKGTQKRERVNLPGGTQNVFAAWKHLNVVGDEVEILNYSVETDATQPTVAPNTLWEFVQQQLALSAQKSVTVTLSAQITSYENYDALIDSLTETIAKYAGIDPEQVRILIDGEQIGIAGTLQFYHSLQDGSAIVLAVTAGSKLEITVGMTNISDQDIEFTGSWSAFAPSAILTMGNTAVITHEDFPMTEEYQKYVLAPGESREITYTFPIPENAARGEYDLLVTFGEQDFVFEKAVHVIGEYIVPVGGTLDFYHTHPNGDNIAITTGNTIEITVGMINVSDQPIYYTGSSSAFVPDAVLRLGDTVIEHEIYPHTEDEVELTLAPGEVREASYRFTIPADATCGFYDLVVSYREQSDTLGQILVEPSIPNNYTHITPTFPASAAEFPQALQQRLLEIIKNSTLLGQAECDVGYIEFACMDDNQSHSTVNYCGNHFHIRGIAWSPAREDSDFVFALVYALDAYKQEDGYDTLLYFEGDIYGHSDAVDQAYQDKPMSGGGRSYKANEQYVMAAKALYTPDFLYDKTFYVQDGYLRLDDGSCFERIIVD